MSTYDLPINWYPGHMAKTRRTLAEQLRKTDLVLELCDARLPASSRNPDLNHMIGPRRRILLLNKADLADPDKTALWLEYYKKQGIEACAVNALAMRSGDAMSMIERATEELIEKALQKGVRKTVRSMVVGVPNVGKSSFINRLHGKAIAKAEDRPGVTRSNQWVHINPHLELLDTPGMLWPKLNDQTAARRLCYIGSIQDDVVDLNTLALCLMEELLTITPDSFMQRFHTDRSDLSGIELLDAVCKGRGWLLKGNRFDYDRCCKTVLDEFRSGKLGRISFETPEDTEVKNG